MIAADNIFGLLAVLLALSAAAAALETTSFGKRVSGVGLILIAALIAAHFGVIPRSAPVYGVIWTYLVPLAIALFLIKADLVKVFNEGGRVLVAFTAGMIGTAAGAMIAALLLDIGPDEAKLAGVFSATYTGGSLNFVAVAEAVKLDDPSQLAAALAIDNILGVGFIIFMNLIAAWTLLHRLFPWRAETLSEGGQAAQDGEAAPLQLANLLASLAIAATVVAVSEWIARVVGLESYSLLFLTALMAAVATIGRKLTARFRGEDVIAMILMYLFFAIIGAGADINAMLQAAPGLFIMVGIIFATHLVFLFAAGAIFKLNYAELVVASLACVAGPPIAAAIAILLKWRNLVAPGVLTGILGYVLGNFVGVGIFTLLGGAIR